jgi:IS30 family transposase
MKRLAGLLAAALISVPLAVTAAPAFATDTTARTLMTRLVVKAESGSGYERSYFKHWTDANGDCQHTRTEVLVAESTQYGIIVNLPEDHTATSVNQAVIAAFADLPPNVKKTLTWDQGVEMARHHDLAAATGIPVFFAERSSPWQRGANENYNRLVRQYFAKGTDLSVHSVAAVKAVEHELNTRPRRGLGYATPAAELRRATRQSARPAATLTGTLR